MYNLDDVIKIYFNCVAVRDILKEELLYDKFDRLNFRRLTKEYLARYSDTENQELYDYIQGSTAVEGHPYAGLEGRSGLNVFAALEELAEQLLLMEEKTVLCQYARLIRLRDVTRYVEEDMLICAFLAVRYKRYGEKHTYFSWQTSIGHNNVQLNNILAKGISENHFHLYGSAPTFQLMWIHMMNYIYGNEFEQLFAALDEQPRMARIHYYSGYQEAGFLEKVRQAALIRAYLVFYLLNKGRTKDIEDVVSYAAVRQVLNDAGQINHYLHEIQWLIDYQKEIALTEGCEQYEDYARYGVSQTIASQKYVDCIFEGERWFIYQMLVKELTDDTFNQEFFNWFWAYLVIKNNLRNEFVQTNRTVGFENFSIYSGRKSIYKDYKKMAETAVFSSLRKGNIQSLEIRITPKNTAKDNAVLIQSIEEIIGRECPHYYVFHFPKRKDEPLVPEELYDGRECRHFKEREKLNKTAKALKIFRERYPEQAAKVLGIDACSQEIGCRPEIFAGVFRELSNHVNDDIPDSGVEQLKLTYHVGEDFLDVVDGLRAVDEAIHFLNLQCGDRIGHGTVLGIDVYEWYKCKGNTILISRQDYLDDVAWFYHKLTEFDVKDCGRLKEHLAQQFDKYFSRLYINYIRSDHTPFLIKEDGEKREVKKEIYHFNIHTYYEAWKLRGDAPQLYKEGYFEKGLEYSLDEYMVNKKYPEEFDSRKSPETSFLYYLYHYNWKVRNEGSKVEEIYIHPEFIKCVDSLQKKMAKYFASCGIGIEGNPSSNISISTMQKYDEHPVVRLYNKDLTWDTEKLSACPQVNISINTDDKGIFHTSLENEYALLACALEKVRDDEGNLVYNRQMIYKWLDNIREMGNLQSFLRKN